MFLLSLIGLCSNFAFANEPSLLGDVGASNRVIKLVFDKAETRETDRASFAARCDQAKNEVDLRLDEVVKSDSALDRKDFSAAAELESYLSCHRSSHRGAGHCRRRFACTIIIETASVGRTFLENESETLDRAEECNAIIERNIQNRPALVYQRLESGWSLFRGNWCNVYSIELVKGRPTGRRGD